MPVPFVDNNDKTAQGGGRAKNAIERRTRTDKGTQNKHSRIIINWRDMG